MLFRQVCNSLFRWKQHYSHYPAGERLVAAFKEEPAPCKVGKGTIRFPPCCNSLLGNASFCCQINREATQPVTAFVVLSRYRR